MNSLLFLVPISLVLLGIAIWALRWAVRDGQFDELDSPAIDILRDDDTDALEAPPVEPGEPEGAGETDAS